MFFNTKQHNFIRDIVVTVVWVTLSHFDRLGFDLQTSLFFRGASDRQIKNNFNINK